MESISQIFWSEDIWTPLNVTWKLYETNNYRHFNDIYYSLITALVLILVRLTFERFIYTPIGIYLGLRSTRVKSPSNNIILESAFRDSNGKVNHKQILGLAKQLDWTQRKVERWVRLKSAQTRPTVLSKFTESAWRCNFYFISFTYGVYVLWNKPWMWDSIYCFINYPHHIVSSEEWWYYNVESGFYLAQLISHFFDIKRKDFWMLFVHHVVTLLLLFMSWAYNFVRIGTLVLIIHDISDIPLEGAKLMNYVKKQRLSDCIFVLFTICWVVSRVIIFPYRIIYYSTYKALEVIPMYPAYYILNGLLCLVLAMNIVWTYFIMKIAIYAIKNNGFKDLRSEDEWSESFNNGSSDKIFNANTAIYIISEHSVANTTTNRSKIL